jgi:maleylacetoacetate isomerase
MILYGHWRSLATYRVRVALNLKGINAEVREVNLLGKAHLEPAYRAINPQGLLPSLDDGKGLALFQSLAIIEYLDEIQPVPPLLPSDSRGRARVRGLAQIIAADAHPLIVPRVRDYLEHQLGQNEAARQAWIKTFALPALSTIELNLASDPATGIFCHGDTPTLADIVLASHVIGVSFFKLSLEAYPRVCKVYEACAAIPAFADAHPLRQPGAPAAL